MNENDDSVVAAVPISTYIPDDDEVIITRDIRRCDIDDDVAALLGQAGWRNAIVEGSSIIISMQHPIPPRDIITMNVAPSPLRRPSCLLACVDMKIVNMLMGKEGIHMSDKTCVWGEIDSISNTHVILAQIPLYQCFGLTRHHVSSTHRAYRGGGKEKQWRFHHQ